jgi:hypothetical protein
LSAAGRFMSGAFGLDTGALLSGALFGMFGRFAGEF